MKLEKEVYIGNIYYTERLNKKYHLNFNCIVYDYLNEKEKEIFDKLQEKTKLKLTLEVEEPILDEAERKYLSGVIRPFRDDVKFICKNSNNTGFEYLNIGFYENDNTLFPCFEKDTMYKGMELNKEYTLEELGL